METQERSPEFWKAEAARARTTAEQMKNPLAKTGMEHIAACYESFARRAEKRPRQRLAAQRGSQLMDTVVSGTRPRRTFVARASAAPGRSRTRPKVSFHSVEGPIRAHSYRGCHYSGISFGSAWPLLLGERML
jgi:hypothetical protein